jgi:hypothetical protein
MVESMLFPSAQSISTQLNKSETLLCALVRDLSVEVASLPFVVRPDTNRQSAGALAAEHEEKK